MKLFKNLISKAPIALLTIGLCMVSFYLFGQDTASGSEMVATTLQLVPAVDTSMTIDKGTYDSLTAFMAGIDWIYGFLVILAGYISSFVPGLKKIDSGIYRVAAVAVVLGLGFYFGAGSNLFSLLITYTVSTSFYEVILKLFKRSPTPAEAAAIMGDLGA